jgi:hypothetical protein
MTALAEVMVTMLRPGRSVLSAIMRLATARVRKKVPRRLIRIIRSNSLTSVSRRSSRRASCTPALFTRQSRRPKLP